MTTTKVSNGELVTSTSTEQELIPDTTSTEVYILPEVVSGTLKFGTGPAGGSPVIDGTAGEWGSYTTTNPKTIRTVQPGVVNFRVVGVGTFIFAW